MDLLPNKDQHESYGRFLRRAGDCLHEKYQTNGNKLSLQLIFFGKNTVCPKSTEAKSIQPHNAQFSDLIRKERDPVKRLGRSLRLAADILNDSGSEEERFRNQFSFTANTWPNTAFIQQFSSISVKRVHILRQVGIKVK